MNSSLSSVLLLSFIASAVSFTPQFLLNSRLNATENEELQAACGRHSQYHTNVLNGPVDYPWAASLDVKGVVTASIISPRHLLVFNLLEKDSNNEVTILKDIPAVGRFECDGSDLVLPKEVVSLFKVNSIVNQFGGEGYSQVQRVVAIDSCNGINTYKPMIIELNNNLRFHKFHDSICLPRTRLEDSLIRENRQFTVYGLGPNGTTLSAAEYTKVPCEGYQGSDSIFCGKSVNNTGLCSGDFGGGAFTVINGRNTLLGIYAEGNTGCSTPPELQRQPQFIDLRDYVAQICRQTGVCPNNVQLPTTGSVPSTTHSPEPSSTSTDALGEKTTRLFQESTSPLSETDSPTLPPKFSFILEAIIDEIFEKRNMKCSAGNPPIPEKHVHIHIGGQQD